MTGIRCGVLAARAALCIGLLLSPIGLLAMATTGPADRQFSPLEVSVRSGEVYVRTADKGHMVPIRVEVDGRAPFYGAVKDGAWSHDFGSVEKVRVVNLADGKTVTFDGDRLQQEIDKKRAEEEAAAKLAIPPDREKYLFRTMEGSFPKFRKLGAVSPNGECSPFVFKGRLMRMELVDPTRSMDAKNAGIHAAIRDVATGKIVGRTGEGCYYQSVYVEGDTVYVTATKRDAEKGSTCGDTILLFESKDLVNWRSHTLLRRPGWRYYNTTLTKGPDGYVLAMESDNLQHARRYFTMFFATSPDMERWTFMPDEKAYPKHRYCGGPFLVYCAGWYYLTLVTEMPCERWCTYIFRTKDFGEWECGRYNPFLMWDDADRRVAAEAADISPEFAERIRTGFVCNASDLEMCEFEGRTCLNYIVGDQRGFYYIAAAWYDGPLRELLERQFR